MENYNNILVDKKRFKIPQGYFDRFELNNINIKKENPRGFLVPDYYFESIDKQQIFNRIYINKIKFIKKNIYKTLSIAAIFIGFIFITNYFDKISNNINNYDVIDYVDQDFIIIENSEYTEFLYSNDLDYNNLISDNDIENYFIESSLGLENLIFE